MPAEQRRGLGADGGHALGVVVLVALVASTVALVGAPPRAVQVPLLALAVLMLGVPHGALDHRPAARLLAGRVGKGRWWPVFLGGYLALAAGVLGAFASAPRATLLGFLALSIVHFGLDAPAQGGAARRWARRFAWGAPPIVLPMALRAEETATLFVHVVGVPIDAGRVAVLGVVGTSLWLAAWASTALSPGSTPASARTERFHALRLALYPLLFGLAPPLVAFLVYFCADHSLRCLLEEARELGPTRLALEAAPAVVATAVLAYAGFRSLTGPEPAALDGALLRVVFQGLAALTLPHMVLWWLDDRARPRARSVAIRPRAAPSAPRRSAPI